MGIHKKNDEGTTILNLDYLEEISGGDEDFIQEMVQLFHEQAPKAISDMKASIDKNDPITLGEVAHKTKPSAMYLGNETLAEVFKELQEIKTMDTVPDWATDKVSEADKLTNEVLESLKENFTIS